MITGLYTTAVAYSTDEGVRWALTRIALATAADALLATGERGSRAAYEMLTSEDVIDRRVKTVALAVAALAYAERRRRGAALELYRVALRTAAHALAACGEPGDMQLLLLQLAEDE